MKAAFDQDSEFIKLRRTRLHYPHNMSAAGAFAVGFVILMVVTVFFPGFPPAQALFEYLSVPPLQPIWGMSVENLLNSIVNGLFWGVIAAAVYEVIRYSRERRPLPPMPIAPHLETPPPEPMAVDERVNNIPPSLTVPPVPIRSFAASSVTYPTVTIRARPFGGEQEVETIEGIGSVYGRLLRNAGVFTVNDLLRVGGRERGRRQLANDVGVTYSTMLRWVYRGDLLRVRGVGKKYSVLLESAGVNTVSDLSSRNPRYLYHTLRMVNREKNLVRRTPPSETIESWVTNAKRLKPMVQ